MYIMFGGNVLLGLEFNIFVRKPFFNLTKFKNIIINRNINIINNNNYYKTS